MGKQLITLEEAIEAGIKLFLCGVDHMTFEGSCREPAISLGELILNIKPNIVLFEGKTPESTYHNGEATGMFEDELDCLSYCFYTKTPITKTAYCMSPSLWDIRLALDEEFFLQGVDASEEDIFKIADKYDFSNARILEIIRKCKDKSFSLVQNPPSDVSSRELNNFQYDLDNFFFLSEDDTPYSINQAIYHYEQLQRIIDQYPNPGKHIADVTKDLNRFAEDKENYDKERDRIIFNNIKSKYDGKNTILVCIGEDHIRTEAPLVKYLESENITFAPFTNR